MPIFFDKLFELHRRVCLFVQRELHAILSPEIDLQRVPLVTARLVYSYWQGSDDDDNYSANRSPQYPERPQVNAYAICDAFIDDAVRY